MAADPAVLAEIARLSGLVNRQKYGYPTYDGPVYSGRGGGRGRSAHRGGGAGYGRGGSARGRGRGYHAASSSARPHGNSVWTPASASQPVASTSSTSTPTANGAGPDQAHKSVHRKLVLNHTGTSAASTSAPVIAVDDKMEGTSASAAPATADKAIAPSKPEEPEEGEIEQTAEERKNAKINPGREVVINGITFIADAKGKKLVRKSSAAQASASTAEGATASTSTPSKTSIDGHSYVRTKSGNLISSDLVKKREMEAKKKRLDHLVGVIKGVQKARGQGRSAAASKKLEQQKKTLCRFFQKTGVCTRGLTCPYLHDFSKISICPRFIRNSCPLPSSKCPLSHVPNAHRMPHCLHFPYCTRGESCMYSHVHVSPSAKVCKDFVLLGWCEKGLECRERHVWECPEFSEKGTCRRKGCKLPHVIRKGAAEAEGEDDASLFVKDVVGTLQAAAAAEEGDPGHAMPKPDDKGKKRALDADEEEEADSSADEVEGELLNNHKKKQKTTASAAMGFNPDAVQANEDFVTLVISDSDGAGQDDDEEEEHSDSEESSVADTDDEPEQQGQEGISHVFDKFARRGQHDSASDED